MARKVERDPDGSGMPWIRVASSLATDEQALALFVLFVLLVGAVTVAVAAADVWRTWRTSRPT